MIVLDVNVLVGAYLTGHPSYDAARKFVRESLEAGGVGVPDVVWSGFIRTVTNPVVSQPPATWPEIRAFMTAVRRHPGYRTDLREMTSPVESFAVLCQTVGSVGNKTSDAYIAAIAIDHGASVATWDKDFDAFPVHVIHPPK